MNSKALYKCKRLLSLLIVIIFLTFHYTSRDFCKISCHLESNSYFLQLSFLDSKETSLHFLGIRAFGIYFNVFVKHCMAQLPRSEVAYNVYFSLVYSNV